MLALLQTLLLAGHLLCVNVAGAGPLVCLWLAWCEDRGDALAGRAGRFLAGASLVLFVLGMVLGLALGVTLWSPGYGRALALVGSRVYFGVWELAFSLVLMALHWFWWGVSPRAGPWQSGARSLLPLFSGTNLLYHFPFLFVIVVQLLAPGDFAAKPLTSADFRARMSEGLVLSQVVHFWLASLAAVGIVLVGYAVWLARREATQAEANRVAIWGGRMALVPTLLQIPVGLWLLTQLPASSQTRILGGDLVSTVLFGAAVLAAAWLIHQLAYVALGDVRRSALIRAMATLVVLVVLMCGALLCVRSS